MRKRADDWLSGRLTAKSVAADALRDLTGAEWPLDAIEIATEPGGAPFARLAPGRGALAGFGAGERLPISVSISHAEGHALCAAAPAAAGMGSGPRRAIGIDLGAIEPRSPAFVATFFTADEQRFVRDAGPPGQSVRANLVWCAKEAVLKALGLGLTVDTAGLTCLPAGGIADPAEWPLSPGDGAWRPFVAACAPAIVPGGGTIRGVWCSLPGFVAALAAHPRA